LCLCDALKTILAVGEIKERFFKITESKNHISESRDVEGNAGNATGGRRE
jgi:hypothetical protein